MLFIGGETFYWVGGGGGGGDFVGGETSRVSPV